MKLQTSIYTTKSQRILARILLVSLVLSLALVGRPQSVIATGGEISSGAAAAGPGSSSQEDSEDSGETEGSGDSGTTDQEDSDQEAGQDSSQDSSSPEEGQTGSGSGQIGSGATSSGSSSGTASGGGQSSTQSESQDSQGATTFVLDSYEVTLYLPKDASYTYVVDVALYHYDSNGDLVPQEKGLVNMRASEDDHQNGKDYNFYPQYTNEGKVDNEGTLTITPVYVSYTGTEEWGANENFSISPTKTITGEIATVYFGFSGVAVHNSTEEVYLMDFTLGEKEVSTPTEANSGTFLALYSTVSSDPPTKETSDTFTTTTDFPLRSYTNPMTYLNQFNAVSLNHIEGSHIIGSILAIDHAARTGHSYAIDHELYVADSVLVAGDYSMGIPSYVGQLVTANTSKGQVESAFNLNYQYDREQTVGFSVPMLYTTTKDQGVFTVSISSEPKEKVGAAHDGVYQSFLSPNSSGENGKVLQNDDFISESSLKSAIEAMSEYIYKHGVVAGETSRQGDILVLGANLDYTTDTNETDTNETIVTVEHGKSYLITQPVDYINFDTQGFGYGATYDETPTTINFASEALRREGDSTWFPKIKLDGEDMSTPQSGEGGEFNMLWNKVIWNLPYASGTLQFGEWINIPGHFIAPSADIRHYFTETDGKQTWGGGNINGCMIANSIESGIMQYHMWPYGDLASPSDPVELSLIATKEVLSGGTKLTDLSVYDFQFLVNRKDDLGTHVDFPTTYSHTDEGEFTPKFTFYDPGTYTFTISEIIPEDAPFAVTYDQSIYELTVTVEEDNITNSTEPNYTITQIQSSTGQESSQVVPAITFTNETIILPETGGLGTAPYLVLGGTLASLGLMLIHTKYKKKVGD